MLWRVWQTGTVGCCTFQHAGPATASPVTNHQQQTHSSTQQPSAAAEGPNTIERARLAYELANVASQLRHTAFAAAIPNSIIPTTAYCSTARIMQTHQ
jgi:hypothetical protein